MNSTKYFVGFISTRNLKISHLFLTPMIQVNHQKTTHGSHNLPNILILYLFLIAFMHLFIYSVLQTRVIIDRNTFFLPLVYTPCGMDISVILHTFSFLINSIQATFLSFQTSLMVIQAPCVIFFPNSDDSSYIMVLNGKNRRPKPHLCTVASETRTRENKIHPLLLKQKTHQPLNLHN